MPYQAPLCVLFWRGFVLSPICILTMAGIFGLVVYQIVTEPVFLWVLGGILGVIFIPIWAIALKRRRWPVLPAEQQSVALTVLVARAKAVKERVCPIVELY